MDIRGDVNRAQATSFGDHAHFAHAAAPHLKQHQYKLINEKTNENEEENKARAMPHAYIMCTYLNNYLYQFM